MKLKTCLPILITKQFNNYFPFTILVLAKLIMVISLDSVVNLGFDIDITAFEEPLDNVVTKLVAHYLKERPKQIKLLSLHCPKVFTGR